MIPEKWRPAAIGVVSAALAFFVFGGLGGRGGSSDPLDAIPRDSFLVVTIDMPELRRSPIYEALVGKEGGPATPATRALGIGNVAQACGFDPLARVTRLAVAVPEAGDKGEVGIAAHVEVSRDELERCTRALADKRGAKADAHEVGSFVVLESGDGARSRIAYGASGLLLVGRGAWLDAMLAAADRKAPSLQGAAEHTALRRALTAREGWRTPTLLATAILPRSLRDRLKSEMSAEADPSNASMAGVLGVAAVGLAIKAGAPGQPVEATVELACDTPEACATVERLVLKKRLDWSKDLSLRLVGFGALLDSLDAKQDGDKVRVTASASADALAAALDRLAKLGGRREPSKDAIGPSPFVLPPPSLPPAGIPTGIRKLVEAGL